MKQCAADCDLGGGGGGPSAIVQELREAVGERIEESLAQVVCRGRAGKLCLDKKEPGRW